MKPEFDEKLLVRYVLGETSSEEEHRLEDQYFIDDSCFERLAIVEEELIDAYVSRTMSGEQRNRFELHFLCSPERRQRVAFAQALLTSAQQNRRARHSTLAATTEPRRSWLGGWRRISQPPMQDLALVGFVLVVLVGSFSVFQNQSLRNQLAGIRAEGENLRQQMEQQRTLDQQLSQSMEQERVARNQLEQTLKNQPATRTASFFLTAGVVRSSTDGHTLLLRRGTDLVQFELETQANNDVHCRVSLRNADDQEVWSQDGLPVRSTSNGASVGFTLPANILVPADYVILLRTVSASGDIEDAGQYTFRIADR